MFEIERRLEEKGIVRGGDIVAAAMELYVPPHGIEADEAARRLDAKIGKALEDPNISSLLLGALLLEDELYVKRKDSEIADDPVFLLSDEIIGMAIAEVIGGGPMRGLSSPATTRRNRGSWATSGRSSTTPSPG